MIGLASQAQVDALTHRVVQLQTTMQTMLDLWREERAQQLQLIRDLTVKTTDEKAATKVLEAMQLPDPIARAIRQRGSTPAMQDYLTEFARLELDHGADPDDIAQQILDGEQDRVARETADEDDAPIPMVLR